MQQTEIWRDVNGFNGYYKVSSLGRVKSLNRSFYCLWYSEMHYK